MTIIIDYKFLKKLYKKAVKINTKFIEYKGKKVLVSYLKYMLEYYETCMKKK